MINIKPKTEHKHEFKNKLLNLKIKNPIQRSLPITSNSIPHTAPHDSSIPIPELADDNLHPRPIYSLHTNPRSIFSPRRSHIPPLNSPPYLRNPLIKMTPLLTLLLMIHKTWQSSKL